MPEPLQRIAIVGPESTGKSTLARGLADYFQTRWVPEFARAYLEQIERPYAREDLLVIARAQRKMEEKLAPLAFRYLFCDTNLLVIRIWSEYKYGQCDPWILAHERLDRYALHLLTDIDLPWEEDPLREHPHARAELMSLYEHALMQAGVPYAKISGHAEERLRNALAALGR
jgi:NadR type nicotinamide-nucleotide adenylyltransferase